MNDIPWYAFKEKITPTKDLYDVHTCTHTHTDTHTQTHNNSNKSASNNLSEFHRFLPEDLIFEIWK